MNKIIMALCIISIGIGAWGQPQSGAAIPEMKTTGSLFTVRIVPKEKQLGVFIVGNQVADFSIEDAGLKAYLMIGKKKRPLDVTKTATNFVINEDVQRPAQLRFEISHKKQRENIELKLK